MEDKNYTNNERGNSVYHSDNRNSSSYQTTGYNDFGYQYEGYGNVPEKTVYDYSENEKMRDKNNTYTERANAEYHSDTRSDNHNGRSYESPDYRDHDSPPESYESAPEKPVYDNSENENHALVKSDAPSMPVQTIVQRPVPSGSEDEIEIDLVELFYVLWERIGSILFSAFLGAVIAFCYTYFLVTPLYTATAKMYILSSSNNSVVNLSDLQISSSLRSDYQELLTSRPVIEKVIDSLGLNYSYKELAEKVTITNPKDTRILNVTVTTPSAQLSADIANQLVWQGQQDLPQIMKSEEPSIFEDAIVPATKSSPSFVKNTLIGALLAAMIYCAFIIFRFVTNDTIVTPDDIYKAFGVQPLATIPEGEIPGFGDNLKEEKSKQSKPRSKNKGNTTRNTKKEAKGKKR